MHDNTRNSSVISDFARRVSSSFPFSVTIERKKAKCRVPRPKPQLKFTIIRERSSKESSSPPPRSRPPLLCLSKRRQQPLPRRIGTTEGGSDLSLSIPTNFPVHLERTTPIGSPFHPFFVGGPPARTPPTSGRRRQSTRAIARLRADNYYFRQRSIFVLSPFSLSYKRRHERSVLEEVASLPVPLPLRFPETTARDAEPPQDHCSTTCISRRSRFPG